MPLMLLNHSIIPVQWKVHRHWRVVKFADTQKEKYQKRLQQYQANL
ncbi:GSCOCG00012978001-RA-CDS [Cotesia congregata]|nr:GSCOCG00012978001-RA-CDS [Cotesia congregata]